jgi:hypothetical protein
VDDTPEWKIYQGTMVSSGGGVLTTLTQGSPWSVPDVTLPPTSGPPSPQTLGSTGLALTDSDQTSALLLPDQTHVTVYGTLDIKHPSRVYRIPQDPTTQDLGINLEADSGSSSLPSIQEMTLFDATGRLLADTTSSPTPGVLSMKVALYRLSVTSDVYLKVAAPPDLFDTPANSDSAPVTDNYVLDVTRDPATASPLALAPSTTPVPVNTVTSPSLSLPSSSSSTSSAPAPSLGHDSPGAADDRKQPLPTLATEPSGPPPVASSPPTVATGPLPARGGAPLGGVLTEGDPVPQLDRHERAAVDLALIGLPAPMPGVTDAALASILNEREAELGHVDEGEGERTSPLIALRGPGGFPLRASSLHDAPPTDFNALVDVLPPAAAASALVAPATTTVTMIKAAATPAESLTRDAGEPQRLRRLSPSPVLSALTLSMAMIFSLVLPDFNALLTVDKPPRFRFRLRHGRLLGRREGRD